MHAQTRVLDAFDSPEGWKVIAAEGVKGSITVTEEGTGGPSDHCLRLDFEFVTGGGYCIIQKPFPMELPENYEFTFQCRAPEGTPPNNLEFKLLDESGENVWWVNRRALSFPTQWRKFVNKKRNIEFAWGPSAGAPLKKLGKLELVIASATGGKGSVYFDALTYRELPVSKPYEGKPVASAGNWAEGHPPELAIDGDPKTFWEAIGSKGGGDANDLIIDFGVSREFGGLSIQWAGEHRPETFRVLTSDDAKVWTPAYQSVATAPGTNHAPTPEAECRYVRIELQRAKGQNDALAIGEVVVRPPEFGEPNKMYEIIAKESPRGWYPKYFLGQQRYWTVVGDLEGGEREALLGEDGALEVDKQSFSIEPFLMVDGQLLTWADGETRVDQRADGTHPQVIRTARQFELIVSPATAGDSTLVHYTLKWNGNVPATASLVLAFRPFQVNPPSQWLNSPGGVSLVPSVRAQDIGNLGRFEVRLGEGVQWVGAAPFDQGDIIELLARSTMPRNEGSNDPTGRVSAVAMAEVRLEPGASRAVAIAVDPAASGERRGADTRGPGQTPAPAPPRTSGLSYFTYLQLNSLHGVSDSVRFSLPGSAQPYWLAARAQIAYILINRDGPAIQPGSRSYERSWARDGCLTSAALLEFGHTDEVRQWIEWFVSNQFPSGKVPCVVDKRGPDPVPENDSHGQLIYAIANYDRYVHDDAFLRRLWPNVQKAVAYIEKLRAERMTGEFAPGASGSRQEKGKPPVPATAFYGLVPESISHEGYSAKPMHSYWDDMFVLLGLKEAAYIAGRLGEADASARYTALAMDFRRTLLDSIAATQKAHGITYLPGCVELGDFDATSTTVSLWPCGEQLHLPADSLKATFDKYWEFFLKRRDDASFEWKDYTPYENRIIGSFIRLGQRERALAVTDFLMQGRRPAEWNQWPEVVYKDPTTLKFLGDLPHTWCGSDFLNSFRAMFLYERETPEGEGLMLLAGVPERWLVEAGEKGLGFEGLPTPYGKIGCHAVLEDHGTTAVVKITGIGAEPLGGVMVANPFDESMPAVRAKRATGVDYPWEARIAK